MYDNWGDIIEMASISFKPNNLEFLISFASGEISEDKEQEILTCIRQSNMD
jgi:hypothetical protein